LAWAANEFSNVAMSMHFWWATKIDNSKRGVNGFQEDLHLSGAF